MATMTRKKGHSGHRRALEEEGEGKERAEGLMGDQTPHVLASFLGGTPGRL